MVEFLANAAVNALLGAYITRLFQPEPVDPSPLTRERLIGVFESLSKEFSSITENAIRNAFSDHIFQTIKANSIASLHFLQDHMAIQPGTNPDLEQYLLRQAYENIVAASTLLQTEYEKYRTQSCPEASLWFKRGVVQKGDNDKELIRKYDKALATEYRVQTLMQAFQTVGGLDFMISSRLIEQAPDLRGRLQARATNLHRIIGELRADARALQSTTVKEVATRGWFDKRHPEVKGDNVMEMKASVGGVGQITGYYQRLKGDDKTVKGKIVLFFPGGAREAKDVSFSRCRSRRCGLSCLDDDLEGYVGQWLTTRTVNLFDQNPPEYMRKAATLSELCLQIRDAHNPPPPP